MRMKVAILDKDTAYLNKLIRLIQEKYFDKLEIYGFSNQEYAMEVVSSKKIEIFLASDTYEINFEQIPKWCTFAYLVENREIKLINNKSAICKYQKIDMFYNELLNLYSDNSGLMTDYQTDKGECKVIAFSSACGGSGASSAAAACAIHLALRKNRVLYLNLETFGSADAFFHASGIANMSDVIYAVKNKKSNLKVKLESNVRQSEEGVYFFAGPNVALDMNEFEVQERIDLINELSASGYDYIVLDLDFSLDRNVLRLFRQANNLVMVSTGSQIANEKTYQALNALNILEKKEEYPLISRVVLLYNMFSNKTSQVISNLECPDIGGISRIEHADTADVLRHLSEQNVFDNLI